jgi:alkylation response protein AidB-like acyl-CoA dehydrogenase
MDLDYTEEQALLQDAVKRLLAERYPFEARRALVADPRGWSRELWRRLAELGLLAATFDEEDGGLDGGPVESLIIAQALGTALSAEPYLSTIAMGAAALKLSGNSALRAELAPQIAAGELILACAVEGERPRARGRGGGGWVVAGLARNVFHGDSADRLLVACEAEEGPVLLLLDAAAAGVARRGHRTFDGLRAAEIRFDDVAAEPGAVLAEGAEAEALIERVVQHALAALAAEAVGIMEMLMEITVEHLKTRSQFGQPLAKFQVLQHRAVEMLIALEQARSMALFAAAMVEAPDALERRKAFAAVKTVIGRAGRLVGQTAVQLHGGIGVTEEHRAGWGLKRLTMIALQLGDADAHAARLADLGGFVEAV